MKHFKFFTAVLFLLCSTGLIAQEQTPSFGGPDAVENLIDDAASPNAALIDGRASQSWFDWKDSLQEERGITLGIDYSSTYLNSSEKGASGDDSASAGMLRFYGSWDLTGEGTSSTGALVWKVEHRHKYTDIAPKGFGFDQEAISLIQPPFSDDKTRLTNFYWRQRFNDGKTSVVVGMLDATDYVDAFVLGSPWTGFTNLAFSIGANTMYVPNDAAMGIAVGSMLSDKLYVVGSLSDAYSDPTDPLDRVDDFFDGKENFTSIEIGLTKSVDRLYFDNTHLTLWHVDENKEQNAPSGWGAAFQYVTLLDDKFMPFIRGGYSDDGGTLMQKSFTVGLGYQGIAGRDLLGIAYQWAEPNEKTFAPGLRNQNTTELFYRLQVSSQIAISPSIEYINSPALNPDKSSLWVFGLRARLAF